MKLGVKSMAGGAVLALALAACFPTGTAAGYDAPPDERTPAPVTAVVSASAVDGSAEILGEAQLLAVAYVPSEAGPRVLVRGLDPKRRIENVRVQLLDVHGEPALFDIDGDGVLEPDHIDLLPSELERSGSSSFFFEVQSAPRVADYARAVRVEIDDGRVPSPPSMTAKLEPLPARDPGEACDLQGFDRCRGDDVCAGPPGGSRCTSPDLARTSECEGAPLVIARADAPVVVDGHVSPGPSLFEPIEGCTNGLRMGRPEALVRLLVDRPYREVIVSTESPSTTFDTVVSVMDGCGESRRTLACNDDAPPPYSSVSLASPTPGTYVIVVDSLTRTGGAFQLRVTAR